MIMRFSMEVKMMKKKMENNAGRSLNSEFKERPNIGFSNPSQK